MPTSQPPVEETDPKGAPEASPNASPNSSIAESPVAEPSVPGGFLGLPLNPKGPLETNGSGSPAVRGSRWVDYDTHELLEMIGNLEDERRWSRLREGFWLALLFHILLFSAFTWIPTYVFKVPKVINPFDVIKQRKDPPTSICRSTLCAKPIPGLHPSCRLTSSLSINRLSKI